MNLRKPPFRNTATALTGILFFMVSVTAFCAELPNPCEGLTAALSLPGQKHLKGAFSRHFELTHQVDGQIISKLEGYGDSTGTLVITAMDTLEGFRGAGYMKGLFADLAMNLPPSTRINTVLSEDHSAAFKKEYLAHPELAEPERMRRALHATPGWKLLKSIGYTQVLEFHADTSLDEPKIWLTVGRETPQ